MDARSERPATGYGSPEAGLGALMPIYDRLKPVLLHHPFDRLDMPRERRPDRKLFGGPQPRQQQPAQRNQRRVYAR